MPTVCVCVCARVFLVYYYLARTNWVDTKLLYLLLYLVCTNGYMTQCAKHENCARTHMHTITITKRDRERALDEQQGDGVHEIPTIEMCPYGKFHNAPILTLDSRNASSLPFVVLLLV